jgi:enamine deaminase RidA (YjgF/YER057c/UK114 family)
MKIGKHRTSNIELSTSSGRKLSSAAAFLGMLLAAVSLGAAELKRVEVDAVQARAGAVVVSGAVLVHTAQLLSLDEHGKVLYAGDTYKQTEAVFDLLDKVLKAAHGKRESVVKLNVYVATDEVGAEVRMEIRRRFGKNLPAVSYMRGHLMHGEALVALDAVAVATKKMDKVESLTIKGVHPVPGGSHVTFLPAGRKAYVSGMASKGTMAVATDETMKQLWSVLEFLNAEPAQVVQLKAFLNPMTDHGVVLAEIKKRFPQGPLPVVHLVDEHDADRDRADRGAAQDGRETAGGRVSYATRGEGIAGLQPGSTRERGQGCLYQRSVWRAGDEWGQAVGGGFCRVAAIG